MATRLPHKIDVHSHFLPPVYRQACLDNGHANPDGMPYLPEWSEETHVELMDQHNISKSILSISSPGTHLVPGNNVLAAKLTREVNAYAADLKKRLPKRFGYFASLPVPDVQASLTEIATSAAEGCDGYVFMTNSHGHYLGDKLLEPIFDELNRRKATIFVHPTMPACPCSSPEAEAQGQMPLKAAPFAGRLPNPWLEFFFDTARVVTNLFISGTMQRCPDIKLILPHLGGAFPPMLSRWTGYSGMVPGPWVVVSEDEVRKVFERQVWFDLAGFPFPGQIKGLMQGVGVGHERLLCGSDYPFTKAPAVAIVLGRVDEGAKGVFSAEQIEDVYHRNAEKLLGSS
jgi:6-methylsalicylate decarboxylase